MYILKVNILYKKIDLKYMIDNLLYKKYNNGLCVCCN